MKTSLLISIIFLSSIFYCFSQTQYSVLAGDTAILSLSSAAGSIQWQQSEDSVAWTNIPGAINNPQRVLITTSLTGKRLFRAVVSGSGLCANYDIKSSVICYKILTNTSQVSVGDWFHGGIVFYVSGTGTGLIAPLQDQEIASWGCDGTTTNAISTIDGNGNTIAILTACSTRPIAASICDNLIINGYSDWFLPARDQLNYFYQQRNLFSVSGGLYWSSTEDYPNTAVCISMNNGMIVGWGKYQTANVRSIRSFSNSDLFSSINSSCAAILPAPFQNEKICIVTVDSVLWKNKILWEKTLGVNTEYYLIYKESGTNNYIQIGNVQANQPGEFIDLFSVPESHGDKYKISVLDSCGVESNKSLYHKTINLTIAAFGSTMGLNWDDYIDESGTYTPFRYYIYRGISPSSMVLHDSVSGSFNSYNDLNVFNVYYYKIGVKKTGGCNTTKSDFISFSNKKDNTPFIGINEVLCGAIKVSPNPFSEQTTIEIPNFKNSNTQITISDITGKIVRTITNLNRHAELVSVSPKSPQQIATNLSGSRNDLQIVIERGNLKPGVYFIELRGDRVYRGKLIVE